MPLQDATAPSRRQILAAERKKHGAYDAVRLAKLLSPKLRFQRRVMVPEYVAAGALSTSPGHLVRRSADSDNGSGTTSVSQSTGDAPAGTSPGSAPNLPPAPANSGAVPSTLSPDDDNQPDHPDPPVASSVPYINYGDVKPGDHADLGKAAAIRNDTSTVEPATALLPAHGNSANSSDSEIAGVRHHDHMSHRMVGMISGLVTLVLVLVALGCFFKRYRDKLSSHSSSDGSRKHKRAKSCVQRLGSVDLLRSGTGSSGKGGFQRDQLVACEDKTGSSDFLVSQGSPTKAGPFDRAIANMFSNADVARTRTRIPGRISSVASANGKGSEKAARPTRRNLSVASPKAALVHQRSLDSIAEVQEPPASGAASEFDQAKSKRDTVYSVQQHQEASLLEKHSWTDRAVQLHRPMTSPGRTSTFGSTLSGSLESRGSGCKLSPARPQSSKLGEIEMTMQGSKLLIRDKPCTATLRRPLSSAGSSFRSALRKTRGYSDDGGAICIETDDIIGRETEETTGGDRELRSHFSCSTLHTQGRTSCITAASTSPSGSFSFEIKDAVRRCPPITLVPTNGPGEVKATEEEVGGEENCTATSEGSFVRDLDWDLHDCTLTNEPDWIPQEVERTQAGDP